jgi:hypothetical protein
MSFKSLLHLLIHFSGINYLCSLFMKKKIFVLMYHSVGSKKGYPNVLSDLYKHISIDESDFEKQIKYLKKKEFHFVYCRIFSNCQHY